MAEGEHECGADGVHEEDEMHGGAGGHAHGVVVADAVLVGDADSRGCADAESEHEGEVGDLVGDHMRGLGFFAEPADHDEGGRKEEGFDEGL